MSFPVFGSIVWIIFVIWECVFLSIKISYPSLSVFLIISLWGSSGSGLCKIVSPVLESFFSISSLILMGTLPSLEPIVSNLINPVFPVS